MYQLGNPQYLHFLWLLPLLALLFLAYRLWQRRARRAFGDMDMLAQMAPDRSITKPIVKFMLYLLIAAALSFALANPKIGSRLETVKREGLDMVVLLDVSKSMLAEDVPPSRLLRAKRLLEKILQNLVSDRVGLVFYAADAFPVLPLTNDYGALQMMVDNADTDLLSSQGTALAAALETGQSMFEEGGEKSRVLLIISDGEDHEGNLDGALKNLAEAGVHLFAIGVGTEKGGPIPLKRRGMTQGYKQDRSGEVVITRLNKEALQQIVQPGKGQYWDATNMNATVTAVQKALGGLEKQEFESRQFAAYEDQFQWFLGLALVLLLLDTLLLERKTSWLQKLKLFQV